MKNIITPLIIGFALSASISHGQQPEVNKKYENKYQKAKQQGKASDAERLGTFGPVRNVHPTNVSSSNNGRSSCECYVQPDSTYTLAMLPNDDGSTAQISIPFTFCLYGSNYTSLYINNNGNISFGSAYGTFTPSGFPNTNFIMVAPFWGDVDTRSGNGQVWYKITPTAVYVNWVAVGYYNQHGDKLNTFQVIITDGTDPVVPNGGNVAFCYEDMQWTTGDASSGTNGFGGSPSVVGANQGNGIDYIQFGKFDQAGIAYDGPAGLNDGVDWLDQQSFYFNVCAGTNIPPVFSNFGLGGNVGAGGGNSCGADTIMICASGDTLLFQPSFLGPEVNQDVTVTANFNGMTNCSILASNPGNPGNAVIQIIGDGTNVGYNQIDITGTDNGSPVQSTTISLIILVDTTGSQYLNPIITGDTIACESTVIGLDSAFWYDTYVWNFQPFDSTNIIDSSGTYFVTVSKNDCYKSASVDILVVDNPTAGIALPTVLNCIDTIVYINGSYSTSFSGSLIYSWSTANGNIVSGANGPIVGVDAPGTYQLVVTDSVYGCADSNVRTVTQNINPPNAVIVPPDTLNCQVNSVTLNGAGSTSYFGSHTHTWTTSNGSFSSGTSSAFSDVTGPGTYTLTITDNFNGCQDSDSVIVLLDTLSPVSIITAPGILNCTTTTLQLDGSGSTSSSGLLLYTWSTSNGSFVSGINGQNADIDAPGDYTLFVVDSINGCSGSSSVTVLEDLVPPTATIAPAIELTCAIPVITLDGSASSAGSGNALFSWTTGTGNFLTPINNPTVDIDAPGNYTLTITDDINGCTDVFTLNVTQDITQPFVDFSMDPNPTSMFDPTVSFTDASYSNIISWDWDFNGLGSSTLQNPTFVFPGVAGTYPVTLTVTTSDNGCSNSLTQNVILYSEFGVYIPNAFTPNGDGVNDIFEPTGFGFSDQNFRFRVFDRWGELLFETTSLNTGWTGNHGSGDPLNSGIYVWTLDLQDVYGKEYTYRGHVTLLR